jgi:SAM-dependent methyltransferase
MNETNKPFDRNLVRLHRDRAARMANFDDFLEIEVAERLADRLLDIKRRFSSVLILGCKTGEITRLVQKCLPQATITQSDFSPAMVARAREKTGIAAMTVDEEFLPFQPQQFDLIVSNLALHWVNDLPGTFLQITHTLKNDGLFLAALLGGETLATIRQVFVEAECEKTGGVRPRFSPVLDLRDLAGLLQRAGLALPVADIDRIEVGYGSPLKILHDLRGMGETVSLSHGIRNFSRRDIILEALARIEVLRNQETNRIPVLFEAIFLTGWKPDVSQQQPLRPGSADTRLADALGTQELKLGDPIRSKENPGS